MEYCDTINPDQKAEIATVEANMKKVSTVEEEQFLFIISHEHTYCAPCRTPQKMGLFMHKKQRYSRIL
jgi:hypothetical protein